MKVRVVGITRFGLNALAGVEIKLIGTAYATDSIVIGSESAADGVVGSDC